MTHKKGIQVFLNNNLNLHPREQFCEFKKRYIIYITIKDQNPQKLLDWKVKMEPNSLFTKKRRDTNLGFFSFCFYIHTVLEEGAGSRTSRRCAAQALGERESFTRLWARCSSETTNVTLQIQVIPTWAPAEQTYAVFAHLSFFSRRKRKWSWEMRYKVSEMRVQPYQCHAVDSVNSTCWNTTFFISAAILFVCLFIGLFCFRATHRHISLLSFICSPYTVGIFTQRSHIYYIWTMSCTSFQSIQHQTRCWIVTDL